MTFKPPPGWFVDAMTAAVAELVEVQRRDDLTVVQLMEVLMDPDSGNGEKLSKGEHVSALALTAAILVCALASHPEVK